MNNTKNSQVTKQYVNELLEIGSGKHSFYIPNYQREYTWEPENVIKLIEDIYNNDPKLEYFLGTVISKHNGQFSYSIIDGQQRISTIILIKKAIELVYEKDMKINSVNFESANNSDFDLLKKIINSKEIKKSSKKEQNYHKILNVIIEFFQDNKSFDIVQFIHNLDKTFLTFVTLQDEINEHMVFASINSTGKQLNIFELVKSYLFSFFEKYKLEDEIDKFNNLWEKISKMKNKPKPLEENIVRSFLARETRYLFNANTQVLFRKFAEIFNNQQTKEQFLKKWNDFYKFSVYYLSLYDEDFVNKFKSMIILSSSIDTYSCLIIDILMAHSKFIVDNDFEEHISDYNSEIIDKTLKVIEYFRLNTAFITTNEKNITRMIPEISWKIVNKNNYDTELLNFFEKKKKILPLKTFVKTLFEKQVFVINKKLTLSLLLRLEFQKSKNKFSLDNKYSVEHICPQEDKNWEKEDKIRTEQIAPYKQTLANLTLLHKSNNSKLQNKVFSEKRKLLEDNDEVVLNNKLLKFNEWNLSSMNDWMNILKDIINEIWNYEKLDELCIFDLTPNMNIKTYNKKVQNLVWVKNNTSFKFNYENVYKALELRLEKGVENVDNYFNINSKGFLIHELLCILFDVDRTSILNDYKEFNGNYFQNHFNEFIESKKDLIYQLIDDVNNYQHS